MKTIITILLCLVVSFTAAAQEGAFMEIGMSVHVKGLDKPEYNGQNPLGNIGGGYTWKYDENKYFEVYARHTSSFGVHEKGNGLNQVGIQVRFYSK